MTSAPPPAPPTLDPPAWQPPPPPPPPSGPPYGPQLRRSRTDKMIGGVSGGLAEYSGVDPLLWRVGFVALTFAGGSGILVYLLLWLLMPAGPPVGPGETESTWASRHRERPPAGPRSPVPGVTVAGLLILIGVLTLLTNVSDWDIGPRGFLGTALLVVGAGLVAAAFTGGRSARGGLIALGIVLSLALIAVSSGPWRTGSGVGDRTYRPATAEAVQPVYRGGVGDLTLDLTRIDVSGLDAPITTRVDHGLGDLEILLPRDADVRLSVDAGLGTVDVFHQGSTGGGYFPGRGTGPWVGDDTAEFDVLVHNGVGDVEVSRG
jgi:phage shock protein PspC (stress-responsive transcriptional regulator)